ncbi:MAG: DEAD/DEAH box helicase [Candidatus Aenigmatarchaeota archaeon]
MEYVSHPWINSNTIEKRSYQENIVKVALTGNTMVVLPTGLGKTSIAAMVAADRLQKDMNKKILFLAPTRPLVEQHRRTFEKILKIGTDELKVITGSHKPEVRSSLYEKADIIFSTPQTIRNDLKKGILSLRNFSLCIFDEAHRCVGNYAYTYIAKRYMYESSDPLILALTASPGGHRYKINEVKEKLFIKNVEIRSREDKDVRPYVQQLYQNWISVELPTPIKSIKDYLEKIKNERMQKLINWGIIKYPKITKSHMLKLQEELAKKKTGLSYAAISMLAEIIKIDHALTLLETQCLYSLKKYFDKLINETKSKAVARLLKNDDFKNAIRLTNELIREGQEHPKIEKLKDIIKEELNKDKYSRIIVFAQYRDTIEKIYDELKNIKYSSPIEFIGQTKKKGKGLSQKEQMQILNEFKLGFYNILCASQVAEEGLDVVETNLVIFYEPTPSAIRKIQRSGRTGRTKAGKVIILMTKDTRDEAYHWSAYQKEKKMKSVLYEMQKNKRQLAISDDKNE